MSVFTELDREWQHLGTSRDARRQLQRWGRESPGLTRYTSPAELVIEANRRGNPHNSDRILAAVAHHAVAGSELAGRTLLQAIMPGLKAVTRRHQQVGRAAGYDTANLVVCFAWEQVRTYPLDRRPARIAANLVYDTRQRVHRHINRPSLQVVPLEVLIHEPAAPPAGDDPLAWLADATDRGVLNARDATVIAATRLGHRSVAELAQQLGCDPATLRRRRRRAEIRLASVHW
jgi:DNA-directed RNA polymerase specialized sigma24 family protein